MDDLCEEHQILSPFLNKCISNKQKMNSVLIAKQKSHPPHSGASEAPFESSSIFLCLPSDHGRVHSAGMSMPWASPMVFNAIAKWQKVWNDIVVDREASRALDVDSPQNPTPNQLVNQGGLLGQRSWTKRAGLALYVSLLLELCRIETWLWMLLKYLVSLASCAYFILSRRPFFCGGKFPWSLCCLPHS